MPNWCDNAVMIKGSSEDVLRIKDLMNDGPNPFSFNKLAPVPEALRNQSAPLREPEQKIKHNIAKYGAKDWYDWCINNWGTKWDSSETVPTVDFTEDDESQLGYSFQTAWAPPIPVYDKLAEMFPNINIFINYDESGMSFSGWRFYKEGELHSEREYSDSYSSVRRFMEPHSGVWEWLE